jgi:hypothetical protein
MPPAFAEFVRGLPWPSGGRANFFPFARAFRIPALTRSRIRSRSSCATADTMVKKASAPWDTEKRGCTTASFQAMSKFSRATPCVPPFRREV